MKHLMSLMALMVLAVSTAAASVFTEVSRSSTSAGALYLRGHLIPPPYVFETDSNQSEIYIRVDQVAEFTQQGVIRLPLAIADEGPSSRPVDPLARQLVTNDPTVLTTRAAVDSQALVTYYATKLRTGSPAQAITQAADSYRSYSQLVDSVHVTSATSLTRYWQGCPFPFVLMFPNDSTTAANPGQVIRDYIAELTRSLDRNQVICIGVGGLKTIPRQTPEQFRQEIIGARQGQPTLNTLPALIRQDFLRPKTAQELRRLTQEDK